VPWLEFGGDAEQKPWLEEKWGFPAELSSESAKPGFHGFFSLEVACFGEF